MLLNPSIMALVLVSAVVVFMLLLAAGFALQVVSHWDIQSGSESQLVLERRTYLISTLLTWVFVSELVSLLLFVYSAESMSGQFVGAMCATGVLSVNDWGWPTLFLKIAIFFVGSNWLLLNYLDNQGRDYPLIKLKYSLLLLVVPLVAAEFTIQLRYFLEMTPDVITSCCGALFSAKAEGVAAEVSALQPDISLAAFYGTGTLTLISGGWYALRRTGAVLFSMASGVAFVVSIVAIISFISLYIYEHPHHHCPFCLLKSGHDYIGYFLYIPLFIATALGLSVGVVVSCRRFPSLADAVQQDAPRLAWLAIGLFSLFYLLSSWAVLRSNLVMTDVWW